MAIMNLRHWINFHEKLAVKEHPWPSTFAVPKGIIDGQFFSQSINGSPLRALAIKKCIKSLAS